jgi:GTPase
MEPEKDEGPIEYKLKLIDKNDSRISSLASQMRFRVDEGGSECIYVIGVTDDGKLEGLNEEEYIESFKTLSLVADKNNYSISKISEKIVHTNKKVFELLVRENNETKYIDIKVAISGSVDAGKSTFIGTLISGKNDNGRGLSRLAVFNFKHEVTTGRTSSIAQHILGFDSKGEITNYCNFGKKSWAEIVKDSSKIISFFDLAGHQKYLKTTILGMTSTSPDICMIIVGGNMGVNNMTREHLFLCITLSIPFVFIITKIDICKDRKNVLDDTIKQINSLIKLPGIRRIPYKISSQEDVITVSKNIHSLSIVPVFHVSNVTGEGIDYIKQFFNLISCRPENSHKSEDKVELYIETTFYVQGVGTIVGGQLISGNIKINDKLLLGPNNNNYVQVQVKSIHCKRVTVQEVSYGCYVCLSLKKLDRSLIKKGNVIISKNVEPLTVRHFTADIRIMKAHSTTIKIGYEPVIHVNNIRQTAKITHITNKINLRNNNIEENEILRTGDKATVSFTFMRHSEYIKKGDKLLFCENLTKAIGIVV